jgi:uncharacterized protein (DUF885 family)
MRALLLAAILLSMASAHPGFAQSNAERLHALGDELVEREFDLIPALETYYQGRGPRAGRAITNLAPDSAERLRALYRDILQRVENISPAGLGESDRITHERLRLRARTELAKLEYPLRAMSLLTPTRGLHSWLLHISGRAQPLGTEADFEAWLSRIEATSANYDEAIVALRQAAKEGWTTPRALVARSLSQIEAMTSKPADQGPLWGPMARYPKAAGAERRAAFEKRYREALEGRYLPALRRLLAFARDEYLPIARATAGIGAQPGGERAYRVLIRANTTLELSPDEVHALGLAEVARVRAKLLEVARGLGFKGDMKEFAAWLAASPANYPFKTAEEVLDYLRKVHQRVEPALPQVFRRLPKARFEIGLTDPAIAASASATYTRPLADGSRPGLFSMPVTEPKRIAAYTLTALLLHEGMPGHHLDIGLGIELDQPRFRKAHSLTVYSEGWALYAEGLGHELGVYDDPWALLGRYALELHRAARLVVDTGMHAKGWSREQAIRYLVEEHGESEVAATVSIERYMSDPGQALAYKIGELEILRLRDEAKKALGNRFDLREFHEVVLGAGQLPLASLRQRVRAWIAR